MPPEFSPFFRLSKNSEITQLTLLLPTLLNTELYRKNTIIFNIDLVCLHPLVALENISNLE